MKLYMDMKITFYLTNYFCTNFDRHLQFIVHHRKLQISSLLYKILLFTIHNLHIIENNRSKHNV